MRELRPVPRTEFYESAVKHGFYGVDKSGLFGKKDNVRKYWEDVSIKMSVRPAIERILEHKNRIRIVDLGCGSGEGVELLTHIPPSGPVKTVKKEFLIVEDDIELYTGVDVSPAMLEQGRHNYPHSAQVEFVQADLSEGFPFRTDDPYDIYFSSYASQSHLTFEELGRLTGEIFSHISDRGYLVFDLFGRSSPEWPKYWGQDCRTPLPYTMAYLSAPHERNSEKIEWFDVTYWTGPELVGLIESAAESAKRKARIVTMRDRSIFVGRHMDTGIFKKQGHQTRIAVNRLFDPDYRGQITGLSIDIDYLEEMKEATPEGWARIHDYHSQWQAVVNVLNALMCTNNAEVKRIIESSPLGIADELKMLAWLYRNADRFPVVDFWASVMGPQVACVLRNLELSLPQGLGCGHGLFCVVEVERGNN
jgi:SAM-dependent methyltransferase